MVVGHAAFVVGVQDRDRQAKIMMQRGGAASFFLLGLLRASNSPLSSAFVTMQPPISHSSARVAFAGSRSVMLVQPLAKVATAAAAATDVDDKAGPIMDPLIYQFLQQDEESFVAFESLGGIWEASTGIRVWRHALAKGRLPTESDFGATKDDVQAEWCWPKQPFYDKLYSCMVQLQLPRFALRHPQVNNVILSSLIRVTIQYANKLQSRENERIEEEQAAEDEEEEEDFYFLEWQKQYQSNLLDTSLVAPSLSLEALETDESIAQEMANELLKEWAGVVQGVGILDGLFGLNHGLLQVSDDNGAGAATAGYGVQDGIWSHSGWTEIPKLQREIAQVTELQDLLLSLGRRPTTQDSDRIEKFAPRKEQNDGALGAQFDPQLRESVEGISLSNSFSEMLPSEAVLLCGGKKSPALRRLFLAKMVESKLLSYQLSGWTDVPSMPRTRPLYRNRMPSAPGGPIIVCLDTSWSMSGRREALSKAVVLACVSAAHQQGRDCQVVAFSNERGVMDAGILSPQCKDGIPRLLEFLSHSFGGGTDVTGALRYALAILEEDDLMVSADLLLVTDGEIPDPPVSEELMERLDTWKSRKGLEVHGLLIGKSESKPLSRLCTRTHDFLSAYESPFSLVGGGGSRTPKRRLGTALYAKRKSYDDEWSPSGGKKTRNGNQKWTDETDDYDDSGLERRTSEVQVIDDSELSVESSFVAAIGPTLDALRKTAARRVADNAWSPEELDKERAENGSVWQTNAQLRAAVERVEDGLVERGEDARLVVLAMIASEHILLLGSPGTAKSVLGLRLAQLCDGKFFQRLLTRFTTPEELFGPLSLSSLEKDEYRRCTAGFLPTADVAFLDEIFKANSAILNTLLTILNERKFDNAGGRESCPIRCVVGASNELPESDELVALFDRFLIRKEVLPVSDEGVLNLLSMSNPGEASCTKDRDDGICESIFVEGLDEVVKRLASAADRVTMNQNECELMRDLRTFLRQDQNIEISDRRLVKAARLLKISAASDGRSFVDPIDFLLLQHCFWNVPEQRSCIREWMWENLTPGEGNSGSSLEQFRFLLDNLRSEILEVLRRTAGDSTGEFGARSQDVACIDSLRMECRQISTVLNGNLARLDRHIELLRGSEDFLWIDPEDAIAVKQLLLPKAESVRAELQRIAENANALELSLSTLPEAPVAGRRVEVVQALWDESDNSFVEFDEAELSLTMREAKAKYDLETFRKWKRAKKKAT